MGMGRTATRELPVAFIYLAREGPVALNVPCLGRARGHNRAAQVRPALALPNRRERPGPSDL